MRKTQRVRCVCMYVVERGDLPNETRSLSGLLGCGMRLRSKRANHPRHVTGKGSHGLQALQILCGFALSAAVDAVPILGGNNGHVVDSEVLIQSVESSTGSSAATDGY